MKVLKVFEGDSQIVDLSIDNGSYVYLNKRYEKLVSNNEGLLLEIEKDGLYEYFYSLRGDFVKNQYPEFYVSLEKSSKFEWGKVIEDVLDLRQINQVELANKTGISQSHICAIKTGTRKDPSFSKGLNLIKLHPNKEELLGL